MLFRKPAAQWLTDLKVSDLRVVARGALLAEKGFGAGAPLSA
jgi:hypothetical protein